MKALKICLWVAGIFCLLGVVGILPVKQFESIAGLFGVEELPDSPLFLYLLRSMSATYIGIGLFFIILALRPLAYGVLVPFSAVFLVCIGVVSWITGFIVKMPPQWYLCDFLSCVVLGGLILIFYQRVKKTGIAE